MKSVRIKWLLQSYQPGSEVIVNGWVRTFRSNRFIHLNDGSTAQNLQVVVDFEKLDPALIKRITTGASIRVDGVLVESQGKGQAVELQARELHVYGESNPEVFPLQPKKHSLEFLREIAHLRMRTTTFGAIFRIRHHLAFAIHQYFNENDFYYLHTPIITGSDAEGAGEMFQVTNFNLNEALPKNESGEIDWREDFFGKKTNLTVSGQLEAELGAMGLGQVYTFGPTFRAENSNTTRHLAEFWMIEPEVAFADIESNMDLAEDFLKYVISYLLTRCQDDIALLNARQLEEEKSKPAVERNPMSLLERLQFVVENDFVRCTYTEAIDILRNSKPNKKGKFAFPIDAWGADLQSEHERYLVEKHFNSPVILYNYPAEIKAFYMRMNADNKTVAAMDILFPGIGEIVGGSQREERLEVLEQKMRAMQVDEEELSWYLDTRKFGTVPHSGFGLGFERLMLFVTGMGNIRDVIPLPRTPNNAEF